MLTSTELSAIYTEVELLSHLATLKTQRASMLNGGTITSVQTRDLSVAYGGLSSLKEIDEAISAIVGALQAMSPETYGRSATFVRRYYAV